MQKKKPLGVTSRYVTILNQAWKFRFFLICLSYNNKETAFVLGNEYFIENIS